MMSVILPSGSIKPIVLSVILLSVFMKPIIQGIFYAEYFN